MLVKISITFPFSTRINSKGIQDHGKASQTTICRFRLRLEVRNQFEKTFHGSILDRLHKELLQFRNRYMKPIKPNQNTKKTKVSPIQFQSNRDSQYCQTSCHNHLTQKLSNNPFQISRKLIKTLGIQKLKKQNK